MRQMNSEFAERFSVYLDTSFVSALVTQKSDIASTYQRTASKEWWKRESGKFQLYVSEVVIEELSRPEYRSKQEALTIVKAVPSIPITDEVIGFASLLVSRKAMPGPVAGDAMHVAAATVHGIHYVLSWNVKHLANPNKTSQYVRLCWQAGLLPCRIVTPDAL